MSASDITNTNGAVSAPDFEHYSVMLHETVDGLAVKRGGTYLDCTTGGGGHSEEILKRIVNAGGGRLICIDRDTDALRAAGKKLEKYGDLVTFIKGNFGDAPELLRDNGVEKIDGAVADLGVSSFQLDTPERGFSYMNDAPLDMRMSQGEGKSAYDVVNGYDEKRLADVISMYGEERFARKIASFIVNARNNAPIETTFQLNDIIKDAIPAKCRREGPHPSKRTFQAIRIEVNGELDVIDRVIDGLFPMLNHGGRFSFISFHSLEDRIIKHTYLKYTEGCTCPSDFPVCVCGKKPEAKIITKKPILPSDAELEENPRSRSAKLRILEKI
ncbi:MAG: 16S rRNA (cytosine(1402)-N(4))-methyltransferase RsmH [Clostridia bacterium]|nr:16S rRNA (cytosine(1402)-N(4))-methyltransferase RsmH [Clostridia bacterium]